MSSEKKRTRDEFKPRRSKYPVKLMKVNEQLVIPYEGRDANGMPFKYYSIMRAIGRARAEGMEFEHCFVNIEPYGAIQITRVK